MGWFLFREWHSWGRQLDGEESAERTLRYLASSDVNVCRRGAFWALRLIHCDGRRFGPRGRRAQNVRALLKRSAEIEAAFEAAQSRAIDELALWRLLVILALGESGGEGHFARPKDEYQQAFAVLERKLDASDEVVRLRRPGVSLSHDQMDMAFDEIENVMKALPQPSREGVNTRE